MKIGDLVRDTLNDKLGIIIDTHYCTMEDEVYALIQLSDNTDVLCSYGDIELIACSDL
jgi:predicted phosphodiesterase